MKIFKAKFLRIPLFVLGFLFVFLVHGQCLFINGFGTYQFKLGGTIMTNSEQIGDSTISSATNLNLGGGFGGGVTIGGNIRNDVIWETRLYYVYGGQQKYSQTYTIFGALGDNSYKYDNFSIRIEPALRMNFGTKKIKYSISVGAAFSVFNKMIYTNSVDATYAGFTISGLLITEEFTGNIGLGGSASLGVIYPIGKRFEIFGDLNFNALSWAPKKSVKTRYDVAGTDNLEGSTVRDRETIYVKDFLEETSAIDENQPLKALKTNYTMSTYGIRLGLKFLLQKPKQSEPQI